MTPIKISSGFSYEGDGAAPDGGHDPGDLDPAPRRGEDLHEHEGNEERSGADRAAEATESVEHYTGTSERMRQRYQPVNRSCAAGMCRIKRIKVSVTRKMRKDGNRR